MKIFQNIRLFKISILIVDFDDVLFSLSVLQYFHLPLPNYSIDTRVFELLLDQIHNRDSSDLYLTFYDSKIIAHFRPEREIWCISATLSIPWEHYNLVRASVNCSSLSVKLPMY